MDDLPLRERKKWATRTALHEAALRLVVTHGLERVTVEAIADAAQVSRRTFSNYFANKEEALLHGEQERMRLLVERMRARPADEPPWRALTAVAGELYPRLADRDPQWAAHSRLLRGYPSLLARQATTFAALERELAAEVAARLPDGGPPVRARVLAAAFLGAVRVAIQTWLDQPPGAPLGVLVGEALEAAAEPFR